MVKIISQYIFNNKIPLSKLFVIMWFRLLQVYLIIIMMCEFLKPPQRTPISYWLTDWRSTVQKYIFDKPTNKHIKYHNFNSHPVFNHLSTPTHQHYRNSNCVIINRTESNINFPCPFLNTFHIRYKFFVC